MSFKEILRLSNQTYRRYGRRRKMYTYHL